jgi:hypothetical protein
VSRDDANVLFRARDVLDRGDPDELVRVDDTVLARAAIIAPVVARMLAEVVAVHLAELGGRVEEPPVVEVALGEQLARGHQPATARRSSSSSGVAADKSTQLSIRTLSVTTEENKGHRTYRDVDCAPV